jgi:hypothetical protein
MKTENLNRPITSNDIALVKNNKKAQAKTVGYFSITVTK